jgi:hypothetical protein
MMIAIGNYGSIVFYRIALVEFSRGFQNTVHAGLNSGRRYATQKFGNDAMTIVEVRI